MNNKITNDESTTEFLDQLKSLVIAPEDTIKVSATTDDYYTYSNSDPSINWNWNTTTIPSLTTDLYNQISINPIYSSPGSILTNWSTSGTNVQPESTLSVRGDANFEGDITIKGKSILDSLEKIEEKLAILHPNEQLEEKWEKLRELRRQYIDLEKDIIEKEKIWETLKK